MESRSSPRRATSSGSVRHRVAYLLNPWWRESHWLDSQLPPDECRRILLTETGRLWDKPVLRYPITFGDALVLRMRHLWMRNSYFPLAVVHLKLGGRGTQVEVTLRSHYLVAGFVTFWLGFAVVMSLVVLGTIVGGHAPMADLWFILPFPVFGLGLLAVGRALGQGDGTALLDFISRVLDAREVPIELRPLC